MSRNKLYLGFLISIILIVIFYVSYGMMNIGKKSESYTVAVIVDDSSNAKWNAFKEGLNQGLEGHQIYLNLVSTTKFSSLKEECQIISREIENGADGIIIEPYSSDDEEQLFLQSVAEKPVILAGNSIREEWYSVVMPDYYKMGEALADAVIEGEQMNPDARKIGVIGADQSKESARNMLQGFEKKISESNLEIVWMTGADAWNSADELEDNMKQQPVDILAALDNDGTEQCVDFFLENAGSDCRLYGVGRSEKTVYYLDKEIIQTLIVPNEYFMGYQSVVSMARRLEEHVETMVDEEVDFLTVTKENMYDREHEKIVFPTVR